jgi:hypothetical protein
MGAIFMKFGLAPTTLITFIRKSPDQLNSRVILQHIVLWVSSYFLTTYLSITNTSIPLLENVFQALAGLPTIGSPRRLKEVFMVGRIGVWSIWLVWLHLSLIPWIGSKLPWATGIKPHFRGWN